MSSTEPHHPQIGETNPRKSNPKTASKHLQRHIDTVINGGQNSINGFNHSKAAGSHSSSGFIDEFSQPISKDPSNMTKE